MKIKILLIAVVSVFILNGCAGKVEKTIAGWWTIDKDKLFYEGNNVFYDMLSNSIFFEKNGTCTLPRFDKSLTNEGYWKLIDTDVYPYRLKIESENEMFAGVHEVRFERDEENKLLKMIIFSDKLYLKCGKGMFNYDANQDLIDELIGE